MLKFAGFILITLLHLSASVFSQSPEVKKIEPPNWWVGMKHNQIQLMVYGNNLNNIEASFNNPEIKILGIENVDNTSYAFINIEISNKTLPGTYALTISKNNKRTEFPYSILKRKDTGCCFKGFSTKDVIYLITPDRFANGDITNDIIPGMIDNIDVNSNIGRHGGDIQGIINKLDYIKNLGVTAVWITPVVENNTRISYHGYACTDFYQVDSRFGSNELYAKLVEDAHKKDLKIILDHVNNHVGITHPWIKNLPQNDWLNGSVENHHITPHFNQSLKDIHSEEFIMEYSNTGWFVDEMPDLNQRNPLLAKYLIQNTIWWIEFAGIDGIREDTYPYSDQKYLSEWTAEILKEYPDFNIVGEVWIGDPVFLSQFQKGNCIFKDFDTNLPAVTDFALRDAAEKVFSGKANISEIYSTISKDALYTNTQNLVTFLDNHDVARIMYIADEDIKKYKMALTLLLTTRGIPQIYYGTEIGMKGGSDHGTIRSDFPGGFANSNHDAFTPAGRTERENEIYNFVSKLLKIRKEYIELTKGELVHYPVMNELYVYFRKFENQKIFIFLNNAKEEQEFDLSLLNQHFPEGTILKNLLSNEEIVTRKNSKLKISSSGLGIFKIIN